MDLCAQKCGALSIRVKVPLRSTISRPTMVASLSSAIFAKVFSHLYILLS